MKTSTVINARLNSIFLLLGVILLLTIFVTIPVYGQDLFGYEIGTGLINAKWVLEKQGYKVNIVKELTFNRFSHIEIFHFNNEYLKNMKLWIRSYKTKLFIYKWDGLILADQSGAASIKRILQYISKLFGEPEIHDGMESTYKKIDVSLLKTLATSEKGEHLRFVWRNKEKQIEMFLIAPLLPMSDNEVNFSLQYFLQKVNEEAINYIKGE